MARKHVNTALHEVYEFAANVEKSDLADRRDMRLTQLRAGIGMLMSIDADAPFAQADLRNGRSRKPKARRCKRASRPHRVRSPTARTDTTV
jgi:hypothetical protein